MKACSFIATVSGQCPICLRNDSNSVWCIENGHSKLETLRKNQKMNASRAEYQPPQDLLFPDAPDSLNASHKAEDGLGTI